MPLESPLFPAVEWLRSYQPQWLRADVVAGLIAAAVVIPKAMAFATIAGPPGASGPLHCARADGDLRADGHVPPAQRQHHDDDCHSRGSGTRWDGAPRRTGGTGGGRRDACHPRRRHPRARLAAAARVRRQLHFGPGPRRLQDRHRRGDRRGPDPQAAGHPHPEGGVLQGPGRHGAPPARDLDPDAAARPGHPRAAVRPGALRAARAGAAHRGGRRDWRPAPCSACPRWA